VKSQINACTPPELSAQIHDDGSPSFNSVVLAGLLMNLQIAQVGGK
jgi:hypothetical protein